MQSQSLRQGFQRCRRGKWVLAVTVTNEEPDCARCPVSSRSMTRLRTACVTQACAGCAVTPRTRTPLRAWWMAARMSLPGQATVLMKSIARIASAWERRKAAQVTVVRCGDGSMPAGSVRAHVPTGIAGRHVVTPGRQDQQPGRHDHGMADH